MKRRRVHPAGPVAGIALIAVSLWAPVVSAASPVDVPFFFTGAEQSWVVPTGVTSIHVVVIGGHGMANGSLQGGFGASVSGDLAVTPGTTLYVEVGGSSANPQASPFNGGGPVSTGSGGGAGAGGGGSDIRTIAMINAGTTLASRLVVAGGGGGAGSGSIAAGGNAGQPGADGISATGGSPGGPAAGGIGGSSGGGTGSIGQGGIGGGGSIIGGGGGGGYYGGGGGGSGGFDGGGGGGGSSFTGTLTTSSVTTSAAFSGSITITYTPPDPTPTPSAGATAAPTATPTATPADNGAVGATVTVPSSAACIEISTSSVDFGTLLLGAEDQPATPDITVTNCAALGSDIYAHASDATGTGASWSLVDSAETCADTLGLNNYRLGLEQSGSEKGLATTNKLLESLTSGSTGTHTARIWTACPGSSGSGMTMAMTITFLATTVGG
jgi:hypothetical protein